MTTYRGVLACVFMAATLVGRANAGDSTSKEIGRTTEKEINVVLSASFGKLLISKGEPEKVMVARGIGSDENLAPITAAYEIRNRIGYLDLSLGEDDHREGKKKGSFDFSRFDGGKWNVLFSNALPISFDVELGVAKGEFDLTGLQVKDFKLSSGASDVTVTFDEPNTSSIDQMSIECGVGKFSGKNLGNAKFKSFRFEGGVGTATLDFSGAISTEVDVYVEVGMGTCTILIPREVGARIFFVESLVSKIDVDRSIRPTNDSEYLSDNFKSAAGRMNLHVETGLGKVKVRRK
jgi:hypothetical protein